MLNLKPIKLYLKVNYMPRYPLSFWSIVLLLLTAGQCERCTTISVENLSHWTLLWEEARPLQSTLPNINFTEGVTCHIPAEQATYYLNPNGECWRFTQDTAMGLTYEKIDSFSGVTSQ